MAFRHHGSSSSSQGATGITEFEILKARHKFLREDGEEASTWDDQLARKYYENLYREFTVCDLKHFKSGNFSLRWRTEDEVVEGTGETTCGNSRCEFHHGRSRYREIDPPPLTTLELPFAYTEQGENKTALVKVVLCPGCVKKLVWKRRKEKEAAVLAMTCSSESTKKEEMGRTAAKRKERPEHLEDDSRRSKDRRKEGKDRHSSRKHGSRSRSPRSKDSFV